MLLAQIHPVISSLEVLACFAVAVLVIWLITVRRSRRTDATNRALREVHDLLAREGWGGPTAEIRNTTDAPATFGFKDGAGPTIAGHGGSLRISDDAPVQVYASDGRHAFQISPPPALPPRVGKYVRRIETPQGILWFVRFRPLVRQNEIVCIDVRRVFSVEHEGSSHVNIAYVVRNTMSEYIAVQRDPELIEQLRPFMLEFVDAKGDPMLFNPSPQSGLKIEIDTGSRNDPNGGIHVLPNGCRLPAAARRTLFAPLLTGLDDLPK